MIACGNVDAKWRWVLVGLSVAASLTLSLSLSLYPFLTFCEMAVSLSQ